MTSDNQYLYSRMFHKLFFRILALLTFFCTFCFKYVFSLGIQFLGLGFAWLFLDVVREGMIPAINPLELTTWANQYLQFLPFNTWKGSFLFSLLSYGLHSTFKALYPNKYTASKYIIIGLMLYFLISLPYLQSALMASFAQTVSWILIIVLGSIFVLLSSFWDIQNIPKVQAGLAAWEAFGKKMWSM